MPFALKNVVPWGRTFNEYQRMFNLSEHELSSKIISFGDGPASFNRELCLRKKHCTSVDPIYQFSGEQLSQRIEETKDEIIQQIEKNRDNFVWTDFHSIDELIMARMNAMKGFLEDFPQGKSEGRYIYHELPNRTVFDNQQFDLALSSHFLILYDRLGLDFHLNSIDEMLRISKEVRIFPLVNLDSESSGVLDGILHHYALTSQVQTVPVNYEFQKGGNEMLVLKRKAIS